MPVDIDKFEQLMMKSNYKTCKREFIVDGFRNGFSIGYAGPKDVQYTARNLPLRCGDLEDIWEKMMKEVKLGRFAGPFEVIPFQYYIQSPIGLVPKQQPTGDRAAEKIDRTRLIFHLSYPRNGKD